MWRFPLLARAAAAVARAHPGVRVVHGFGVFASSAVLAARRLGRLGIAITAVASAYDTMAHEGRAKLRGVSRPHGRWAQMGMAAELAWIRLAVDRWERRGYAGARLILVHYDSMRRILAASYGLDRSVCRIPYASEAAFREPAPRPPPPPGLDGPGPAAGPLVVAVSRHDPRKGVDVLLQALGRLKASGVAFRACLVGTGPLLAAHRRLAARLGLADRVAIEGFVPEVYPYVAHADVFTLPSLEEGSGSLALLEALQAGVPAVVSAVDGVPEDVDDESALLVPPGDAGALQAALARLLADPALRGRLGAAARSAFERRFSAPVFTEALARAYAVASIAA